MNNFFSVTVRRLAVILLFSLFLITGITLMHSAKTAVSAPLAMTLADPALTPAANTHAAPAITTVSITYDEVIEPVPIATFNGTDTEGWGMYLDTILNPGSEGSGGGENNGYLRGTPPGESLTSYYVASNEFHGDWTQYEALHLDLWSSGGSYYRSGYSMYGDIYLANGEMSAQLLLPYRPPATWETFTVNLNDGEDWVLGGGATNLTDVLTNVTDFQVRAEYGVGGDTSGLDNVMLGTAPEFYIYLPLLMRPTSDAGTTELVEFIKVGRSASAPSNTTGIAMPPKGGNLALSDQDLFNIVAYLRALQ